MSRLVKTKELLNTNLATNYGGWMYCDKCKENIGYLCYATYDRIDLVYTCNCGSVGKALIDFDDSKTGEKSQEDLIVVKNRLCCPQDTQPLITLLDKKLKDYELKITCKSCEHTYYLKKKI